MRNKKIKAWAIIDRRNEIIDIAHGKEEIVGYDILITKKEARKCWKYHCEGDDYFKIIPVEIKLLSPNKKGRQK